MDDSQLRSLRADVEAQVDLPDFGGVAARAERIRRRRATAAGAAVALVVAVVALAVTRTLDLDRSQDPVHQPRPDIDRAGARAVLTDPDAEVDADASRVDGAGAMLAVVVVRDGAAAGADGSCPSPAQRSAMRWSRPGHRTRAWAERVRDVEPVPGGFVVAALPRPCRTGDPHEEQAYLVDDAGEPRGIAWGPGAEPLCAVRPGDAHCHFDVRSGRAVLGRAVLRPAGTLRLGRATAGVRWATTSDLRRLYWSNGGGPWRRHDAAFVGDAAPSVSAVGRWGVLAAGSSVEVTSDGGATWRRRDLSAALGAVRVGDIDWTVTSSGALLGVTQLVGRGDVLFRSTDATWSRFVETDVHTAFGLVRPAAVGGAVYVVDAERWAVSTDGGATWHRTPPLP